MIKLGTLPRPVTALALTAAAFAMAAVFSGCATSQSGSSGGTPSANAETKSKEAEGKSKSVQILGTQYATSTGKAGCETAEVFIHNPGPKPITFTGAYLDGVAVPGSSRGAVDAARKFSFDLGGSGVRAKTAPPASDPRVIWSQFQPSSEIPAGGFGIFQIGFNGQACHSSAFNLDLETSGGARVGTVLPGYFPPGRRIMAVTWSPDGSVINVQYSGGTPPKALLVNEKPLESVRVLEHSIKSRPGVVCAAMPKPAQQGEPVLITIDFGDGKVNRVLARALLDIVVDAPNGWKDSDTLPKETRLKYGFDANPAVKRIDMDVACDDTRAHRHGSRAPDVIEARLKAFKANPARLYGVEFCTAQYPEIWNIYTPIADSVFAKPYQLSLSTDPAGFIENEIDTLSFIVGASMPRPVIWVPERYAKERRIEARELEVLSWSSFMSGARGICFHFWKNDPEDPFANWVDIPQALPNLCRDINSIRTILSQMMVFSSAGDMAAMTKLYEGWSGDAGVLLLVRNMRYSTDRQSNDGGRNPRFRVAASENITVKYTTPPWLQAGQAVDALSGEALDVTSGRDGKLSIRIPRLDSYKLVWIPNTDPTSLSGRFVVKSK